MKVNINQPCDILLTVASWFLRQKISLCVKISYTKTKKLAWMYTEIISSEILVIVAYWNLWEKKLCTGRHIPKKCHNNHYTAQTSVILWNIDCYVCIVLLKTTRIKKDEILIFTEVNSLWNKKHMAKFLSLEYTKVFLSMF